MRNAFFVMVCVISSLSFAVDKTVVVEDFESFKAGEVPSKGWRTRDGSAKGIYSVEEETDNKFLSAKYTNRSVQLFKEKAWKMTSYPWLSWKWRVHEFPVGSDERVGAKNDSAAGLYIVFPGPWFVPRVIKYVWSESVPVGTVIKRDDRFPVIVVRSGTDEKGQWVVEKRNVMEDYKKLFSADAKEPKAIGFLTDGNSVKCKASADYDDIHASIDANSK